MDHSEGFLKIAEEAKSRVREITVEQAASRVAAKKDLHFIDVREDNEWAAGHAVGAEHSSRGVIERDIEKKVPDKETELILYCGGGYRSALATDSLQKMGYKNVYSVAGGWAAWTEAGLPTSTD
ncbi:MAG: rhodanese-like domain-containing protein [Pyrinomonadaceae bacterium]